MSTRCCLDIPNGFRAMINLRSVNPSSSISRQKRCHVSAYSQVFANAPFSILIASKPRSSISVAESTPTSSFRAAALFVLLNKRPLNGSSFVLFLLILDANTVVG
eukprot:TRINITY_DN96664_c0_g1_i1.p3 TRINITY_DN96664_c0_g1~~TRINITY_DN96664_c0_g1_i1.p3  ORF type:complete len:105 (-),score=2.81 TRINITY_DN96664_c0_g1_i1:390-704(-)